MKVYSVAPGVIDSDMQAQIRSAVNSDFSSVERFVELKDNGELRTPKHIASLILSNLDKDEVVWSVRDLDNY